MEIKIIKNEESKWRFPCKGIRRGDNLIVGFQKYGEGAILESDNDGMDLFCYSKDWAMDEFKPLEEEKRPIDWDKAELPIWFTHRSGSVNIISQKGNSGLAGTELCEDGGMIWASQYDNVKERNEFLNSLKILPKGTKIEITI